MEGERAVTLLSSDIVWGDPGRGRRMFGGRVSPVSQHESSENRNSCWNIWTLKSLSPMSLNIRLILTWACFFFFCISVLWLFPSLDAWMHLIGRFVFMSPSVVWLLFCFYPFTPSSLCVSAALFSCTSSIYSRKLVCPGFLHDLIKQLSICWLLRLFDNLRKQK